jgi:uncharacterized protein involved in cysteine biosynthesis
MIAALISFFGGSVFRMLWGEISSWMTARQDHSFEIERMRLQGDLDGAAHARNMEAIKVQAELGVKTIQVQAETDLSRIDADVFSKGVELTGKLSGFAIVDIWNGVIRPMLATECMLLWSLHLYRHNWTLDEQGWALVGAALGIFVADRSLLKRGK